MRYDDLPTSVKELQQLLMKTQSLVDSERQRSINAEQRACVAEQQSLELAATVEKQQRQLTQSEQKIRELLAALRGKQRERVDPAQLMLFDVGELESFINEQLGDANSENEKIPANRRRRQRSRRVIPDDLPREEIEYTLAEDERLCPHDKIPMPFIRWEISQQLDYQPAVMKVIVHKRAVYACPKKHDAATLITAPKPPQPIEKGLAAPGLLAATVVGKFGDHLPGYRLEDIFSRHGVDIRRSTIYDWFAGVAKTLRPLYDLMKQRVLSSRIIHTDDTQVKLIDAAAGETRLARYWAYVGDVRNPYSVYDFTESRKRDGPAAFLSRFSGYLQADAYGGYDGIYSGTNINQKGAIIEVACWTHARRYWHKAIDQDPLRAHHVLAVISRLYEIEHAANERDVTAAARKSLREEHAAPLLADLHAWLETEANSVLPKSVIGKAFTYTRNQWTALNRYVEDGELNIDNNISERTVKPIAIGRKNWLFVGSIPAGHRAAILMSMIASCKANHVEPWSWLKDTLTQIPRGTDLEHFLPDTWLKANPNKRWNIADRRKLERKKKNHL